MVAEIVAQLQVCALCRHEHRCLPTATSDDPANPRMRWLCDPCADYVTDGDPWSANEMCLIGMEVDDDVEPF